MTTEQEAIALFQQGHSRAEVTYLNPLLVTPIIAYIQGV